ncbi:related to Helicase SWR1 [Saccharomycodes ludwigii]|uniref:Helicase SWR1 n=1 Tax=Saccharomycodes ludwigii TaxID=36035 RepID=A0A376B404_9ASCO|nr:hypothetical protein SCDLUD_004887 [Saccharomycodes ludwigii]KAH3899444.1 hypothetical protein SCDLUD_004887 [Saccharomycodes ludwigii]SSD59391.1 related to Helicase SWR1 [Saccharomycodes ludwigii]
MTNSNTHNNSPILNNINSDSSTNDKKNDIDLLADLKFQYEVLTNELFHLYNFTNIDEFDPLFREKRESLVFSDFLKEHGLNLESTDKDATNTNHNITGPDNLISDNNDLPASRRIRSRRRRGRRIDGGETKATDTLTATKYNSDGITSNINNTLDELVNAKYGHLRKILDETYKNTILNTDSLKNEEPKENNRINDRANNKRSNTLEDNKIKYQHRNPLKKQKKSNMLSEPYLMLNVNDEKQKVEDPFYFTPSSSSSSPSPSPSSSESQDEKYNSSKLKFKFYVNLPKPTVTNPENVTKPKFNNLSAYLTSFRSLDEDVDEQEYENFISKQKKVFQDIRKGVEKGVLEVNLENQLLKEITLKDVNSSQNTISNNILRKPEPITFIYKQQNQFPIQDHLMNQGIKLSKIFHNSTRARIARAKKVSQMVEQHFKHISGAEERMKKQHEKNIRALARTAAQAVRKRWSLAEKAYRVLKKDEEEELKKIQGKKHLSEMLEKSTKLLGAQLNKKSLELSDDDLSLSSDFSTNDDKKLSSVDDMNIDTTSDEDREGAGSQYLTGTIKDANVSLDENRERKGEYDDSKLSVEQLKEKYAKLDEVNILQDTDISIGPQPLVNENSVNIGALVSKSAKEEINYNASQSDVDSESDSITTEYSSSSSSSSSSSASSSSEGEEEEEEEENIQGKPKTQLGLLLNNNELEIEEKDTSFDADYEEGNVTSNYSDEKGDFIENKEEYEGEQLKVVDVPVPPLLKGTLRSYQKQGLNWLASLYNNNTNGILADEMGLGKTIQTISLLCWLACEKQNWGPHLIVVPTSVLLNWEMEFKRFAPGFKVLAYYGSPQERKRKRKGWNNPNSFHVCITSYQLVVTDQHSFKRKTWQYMILDEAHNIKNFRSTRWQALLNFNTERRLLLTGTPLQNNLAELWSLLYFLMPKTIMTDGTVKGFADLEAFQNWFGNPVNKIMELGTKNNDSGDKYNLLNSTDEETQKTVDKLHQVLRPYLLRRLKADVEKQMPAKYEHIIYCKLSKRQRYLYDDFMARAQTKETLASGNFMSIINCLMQLRKVCNHPDLFEVRPVVTSFAISKSIYHDYLYLANKMIISDSNNKLDLNFLNLKFLDINNEQKNTSLKYAEISKLSVLDSFVKEVAKLRKEADRDNSMTTMFDFQDIEEYYKRYNRLQIVSEINKLQLLNYINQHRCKQGKPKFGLNLIKLLKVPSSSSVLSTKLVKSYDDFILKEKGIIKKFAFLTPKIVVLENKEIFMGIDPISVYLKGYEKKIIRDQLLLNDNVNKNPVVAFNHFVQTKLSIEFPDKSLLQYDCGKLQKLTTLLADLKKNGHRVLIFTQMTKVLDILEQFLNYHGYLYLRLDGATKIEDRQILTERFNNDSKITVFILSSRSGGLGINLTGADTVIFYDSDWNPAMDKQCQDRCHRIGQTRDVHIYRFVSEHTIESNILDKANQKRRLDNVVIQQGDFTTDYFSKLTVKDLLGSEAPVELKDDRLLIEDSSENKKINISNVNDSGNENVKKSGNFSKLLSQVEDEDDARAAKMALQEEENVDTEDFKEYSVDNNSGKIDDIKGDNYDEDEYEGTKHVEEYMIKFIANGYYYD